MLVTTFTREGQDGVHVMVSLNPQDLTYLRRGHTNTVEGEMLQRIGLPGVARIIVTASGGTDAEVIESIRRQTNGDVVVVAQPQ